MDIRYPPMPKDLTPLFIEEMAKSEPIFANIKKEHMNTKYAGYHAISDYIKAAINK